MTLPPFPTSCTANTVNVLFWIIRRVKLKNKMFYWTNAIKSCDKVPFAKFNVSLWWLKFDSIGSIKLR